MCITSIFLAPNTCQYNCSYTILHIMYSMLMFKYTMYLPQKASVLVLCAKISVTCIKINIIFLIQNSKNIKSNVKLNCNQKILKKSLIPLYKHRITMTVLLFVVIKLTGKRGVVRIVPIHYLLWSWACHWNCIRHRHTHTRE